MYYVYLLQSEASPNQTYVGFTKDLRARVASHNAGESKHTSKFVPWRLASYHAFPTRRKAQEFEFYLKTGSGQAFSKKRLL